MKLCYVEPETRLMFFTDKPIDKVWGDDWNDAPWEHNAGRPYEEFGPFKLMVIDGELDIPGNGMTNSQYSVEQINAGAVAWLCSPNWVKHKMVIKAGDEFDEVLIRAKSSGLRVFIEARSSEAQTC